MARAEKEKEREKEGSGVEILVHTTAPCKGIDDNHYRALASAYLLFEPVKNLSLDDNSLDNQLPAPEGLGERHPYVSLQNPTLGELRQRGGIETAVVTGDDDIYDVSQPQCRALSRANSTWPNADIPLESPQVSFCSVMDNLNSPILKKPGIIKTPSPLDKRKTSQLAEENESSWKTPPSVIPDSQSPQSRMVPEFSSPTKILELYRQHFDSSSIITTATDGAETSKQHAIPTINFGHDYFEPLSSSPPQDTPPAPSTGDNESIQVIHDTPFAGHLRKPDSPKSVRRKKATLPTLPTFVRPGYKSATTRSDAPFMPPPSSTKESTQASPLPTPSVSPSQKRRKIEVYATPAKLSQRNVSPTKASSKPIRHLQPRVTPHEIHPPPPRTSIWAARPPQIITPALYHLAIQLDLPRRFHPASQTRPLRDLERGYWAITTTLWPQSTREQAWAALGAYVGQGKAGWGVWGERCFAACTGGEDDGRGDDQTGWRVYCWGGVAGHVYLLLYLVSQRRVKGTGAKWIDGGGEVALRMS